jgi:hypothetical protein
LTHVQVFPQVHGPSHAQFGLGQGFCSSMSNNYVLFVDVSFQSQL